jgi:hypothetical protein
LLVAAAALLLGLVGSLLLPLPATGPAGIAMWSMQPRLEFPAEKDFKTTGQPVEASSASYVLADWIPTRMPSISDVRFESWGDVDLVALVPREPVESFRGIPATIESVAPICRYSAELPVISQWANGIQYTLNLLRSRLPGAFYDPHSNGPGFGVFVGSNPALTC